MDTGSARTSEEEALQFHANGRPGKLSIAPTKPLTTQRDLSLVALGRSITRPIRRLADTMTTLAAGDLSASVPAVAARDEVGAMARAVQIFKDSMRDTERLRIEQSELKAKTAEERHATMLTLAHEFEQDVGGIVATVSGAATRLQDAARSMSTAAAEAASETKVVSSASAQASEHVQAVSAATRS